MKLGIMQPYFMPYIGYFSLIKHTDEFILFDPVQFIHHGWIERNRVQKQNGGWIYIQVPLIKPQGRDTLIKDVKINYSTEWKKKILAQLVTYRKKAPYYYKTIALINDIFQDEYDDITHLVQKSLKVICEYLNIQRDFPIFSEMNMEIEPVNAPDEWALNICKSYGCNEYINPIGGLSFFDRDKYIKSGIDIKFQKVNLVEYDQKNDTFEPGLSIIDVLMFNSPEEINKMLDNFDFE